MTLNQAIIQVISNQFKKDAKEAHTQVEAAFYKIEKYNGHYRVTNPATHRYCYIVYSGHYMKGDRWVLYWGSTGQGRKEHYGDPADIKVDLVNMLNTPYNKYMYECEWEHDGNRSEAMQKYVHLKSLKRDYQTYDVGMTQVLKDIDDLQKKLIKYTEQRVNCMTKLNNYRNEIGLERKDTV